jgi:hypothetical protein
MTTETAHVVPVHGGFVDGSGWHDVYDILKHDGHGVSIVQNATTTLADDVAVTRQVVDAEEARNPGRARLSSSR